MEIQTTKDQLAPAYPTYDQMKERLKDAEFWQNQGDMELENGQLDLLVAMIKNYIIKRKILNNKIPS